MISVCERVEKTETGEVINLSGIEKALCRGTGEMYARFESGQLVELFAPQYVPGQNFRFIQTIFDWLANAQGEVWFVENSGDQLCSPEKVSTEDAPWFSEQWRFYSEKRNKSGIDTPALSQSR